MNIRFCFPRQKFLNLFAPGAIKIIMFEIQKFKDSKDPKIFEDAHLRGLMVASDDFGKFAKF